MGITSARLLAAALAALLLTGCTFPASFGERESNHSASASPATPSRPPGHNVNIQIRSTLPTTITVTDGVYLDVQEYHQPMNGWRMMWVDPEFVAAVSFVGHGHGTVSCQITIDGDTLPENHASGDNPLAVCTATSALQPKNYRPDSRDPHEVRASASTTGRATVLWITPNGARRVKNLRAVIAASERFTTGDVHMIVINLDGESSCNLTVDGTGQPRRSATERGQVATCHDFA